MINILNNHKLYKEKYNLLHETTKIDSKGIYDILKIRKINLWEFSYNLNKVTKNKTVSVFKALPYLLKGFNIKETETLLKHSTLSRYGLNYLNNTVKNKKFFLYNNIKLSNTSHSIYTSLRHFSTTNNIINHISSKTEKSLGDTIHKNYFNEKNSEFVDKRKPNLFLTRFKGSVDWLENRKKNNKFENRPNRPSYAQSKKIKFTQLNSLIANYKLNLSKKRYYLKKLSNYKLGTSDLTLLNNIIEIRKTIDSKYKFNLFLSGSQIVDYSFSNKYKLTEFKTLNKIFKSFFSAFSALISKPEYFISPNKIYIRLFYFLIPIQTVLKKERKLKYLLRKDLTNNQKYKNVFNKLINKFKIKGFLAKWKESNNLVQLPLLPDALFSLLSTVSQNYNLGFKERSLYFKDSLTLFEPETKLLNKEKIKILNENETKKLILKDLIYDYLLKHSLKNKLIIEKNSLELNNIKTNQTLFNLNNSNLTDVNLLQFRANQIYHFFYNDNTNLELKSLKVEDQSILKHNNIELDKFLLPTLNTENEKLELETKLITSNISFETELLTNLGKLSSNKLLIKLIDKDKLKNGFNSLQLLKFREYPTILSLNERIAQFLLSSLEKYFNKEVVIDIKRIKYPYHNSSILSQILKISSHRTTFRNMMKKLFYTAIIKNPTKLVNTQDYSIIPSYLSGIKIRLAGRLINQRLIPRFTAQSFQMGSLARGKVNYLDTSRITHKNNRGAFSFTVTTGHLLENKKIKV